MKSWFNGFLQPSMLRLVIHKTGSRMVYAIVPALMWEKIVRGGMTHIFWVCAIFYAAMAVIAYLRLTGTDLPRLCEWMTSPQPRRRSTYAFGDVPDAPGEDAFAMKSLSDFVSYEQRIFSILFADVVCCALLLILTFVF
jgi:hypothetical protein